MSIEISIEANFDDILDELEERTVAALERIGSAAERYAADLAPVGTAHGGQLRQSITHNVDVANSNVQVGTALDYGAFVEFGTGVYAESGGRLTPWVYKDDYGNWHYTRGVAARPFLRPALQNNIPEYTKIVKDEFGG